METNNFSCRLLKVTTEQFAIFEDNYTAFEADNLEKRLLVDIHTRFAANIESRMFGVYFLYELKDKDLPVLLVEAGVHFQIDEATWKIYYDIKKSILKIPNDIAIHLLGICISTSRGILHSKTEGTKFNGFILPLLNTSNFIENDVEIFLDPNKSLEIKDGKIKTVKPKTTKVKK